MILLCFTTCISVIYIVLCISIVLDNLKFKNGLLKPFSRRPFSQKSFRQSGDQRRWRQSQVITMPKEIKIKLFICWHIEPEMSHRGTEKAVTSGKNLNKGKERGS